MSRARDNINSSRSREEIDHDQDAQRRAAELRLQMLGALDPAKYQQVMEEMHRLGMDPKTTRRTRAGLLNAYARNALQLVQPTPQFNVAQVSVSAADLLRQITADTSGCISGPSAPAAPGSVPTSNLMDVLRLSEPVQQEGLPASEPTDGLPERVRSEPAPVPPAPALARPVPTETVGGATGRCPQCHCRTDDEPHECLVPEGA